MTARSDDESTSDEAIGRRVEAAGAALHGDADAARAFLDDPVAKVRAAAVAALARLGECRPDETERALCDPDPLVRRRVCELATRLPLTDYSPLLFDPDDSVVEAAAYALGEVGFRKATPLLANVATSHSDPLCREAAVAALGAIGDPAGKRAVLSALDDAPAVRRRAVIALAAFSGKDVESALRAHLSDRDWQTRQAAADLLGVSETEPR